jgi:hypothetical protein
MVLGLVMVAEGVVVFPRNGRVVEDEMVEDYDNLLSCSSKS